MSSNPRRVFTIRCVIIVLRWIFIVVLAILLLKYLFTNTAIGHDKLTLIKSRMYGLGHTSTRIDLQDNTEERRKLPEPDQLGKQIGDPHETTRDILDDDSKRLKQNKDVDLGSGFVPAGDPKDGFQRGITRDHGQGQGNRNGTEPDKVRKGRHLPDGSKQRNDESGVKGRNQFDKDHWIYEQSTPNLACVICNNRIEEPLVMLKSAVLFTKQFLVLHIVAEEQLHDKVKRELDSWPSDIRARTKYHIYNVTLPADVTCDKCKGLEWKKVFKPCATQRLFLDSVLSDVDSILYVDVDTLFLAPVEELWALFDGFNSTQFIAVAAVAQDPRTSHYLSRSVQHIPYYGPSGVNSGVLLMNLTRIRASTWSESMTRYLIEYNKALRLGDQDLINIYMHFHPDATLYIPCQWNYRGLQCKQCPYADEHGIAILHGSSHIFINAGKRGLPPFRAVYTAFKEFKLGSHRLEDLLVSIRKNLFAVKRGQCNTNPRVYTKRIEHLIDDGP